MGGAGRLLSPTRPAPAAVDPLLEGGCGGFLRFGDSLKHVMPPLQ